jgi:hypothetical protein
MESAQALLALAEVIPGEDPTAAGQSFRDMTTATLQALALPQPQQQAAMVERCRSRGWSLMLIRDIFGVVRRAVAMRPEATSGLTPSPAAMVLPNPLVTTGIFRHQITRERYVIPMTREHLEFCRRKMQQQRAPPISMPSSEELDNVQAEGSSRKLLRDMEGVGPSQQ